MVLAIFSKSERRIEPQYDTFLRRLPLALLGLGLVWETGSCGEREVLKEAGATARILDCSCGIGALAISLAKLGYEVSGSDGSAGMVEQAMLAARNAGLNIPLTRPDPVSLRCGLQVRAGR